VVQIFNTNPRIWRPRIPTTAEIETLKAGLRKHRMRLFFHSIYLINLASADTELRQRSVEALAVALATGAAAGAEALVTHIGSHRGEAIAEANLRILHSIARAIALASDSLDERPGDGSVLPTLLLETGAGAGHTVGGRLEHLATLLALHEASRAAATPASGIAAPPSTLPGPGVAATPHPAPHLATPRLGICIDTAHLFAAGYALHEEAGLEGLIAELRALELLDRIGLVHLNDSRTPFGSKRDYHENLGEGLIGYLGLSRVVRHPALAHVPFVLEVPGAEGHGPDAANVALAKRMRAGSPPPARFRQPAYSPKICRRSGGGSSPTSSDCS
jgi:deoxyribonuclease-4